MKSKASKVPLDINKIVQSLRRSTEKLEPLSSERLRELNKEIFTPRVVSVGPIHHGKKELKSMEEHKQRYLCAFLERTKTSMEEYIEGLEELEISLRQSYVEMNGYNREEFMEMMAVDGAFLMEYLLRYPCVLWKTNDRIFGTQHLSISVKYDLLLIDNQIPFFFLKHLFGLFKKSRHIGETITLTKIVQNYLCDASPWKWSKTDDIVTEDRQVNHLLHFLIICLQQLERKERRQCKNLDTPTISELHQAGVKFKPGSTNCLSDINFTNGILEIPKLKLTDHVEQLFRNMQCHKSATYVNDYVFLMDMLINSEEDMKLLVQNRIIDNWLQDNHAAATVFNNLNKGNIINTSQFYYSQVIEDLNAYYNTSWHKWKATLKQNYFNHPWTIISVVVAAFLLLLTFIQNVCLILEV